MYQPRCAQRAHQLSDEGGRAGGRAGNALAYCIIAPPAATTAGVPVYDTHHTVAAHLRNLLYTRPRVLTRQKFVDIYAQ